MPENSAKKHYDNLLAKHYSWMFGDFDRQVEKNIKWFEAHDINLESNGKAIDFGCGSGFQSLALSSLGFRITGVDFNRSLLDELKNRAQNGNIQVIQSDILNHKNFEHLAPFELAVCMGDTLTHLPSKQAVEEFFSIAHDLLEPKGKVILSFRDLSTELTGIDRFIPVQSDENKIMTAFLEYKADFVLVHDLIYQRNGNRWDLEKSVYKKIRLSADNVKTMLVDENFEVFHLQSKKGLVSMVAAKS